MKLHYVGGPRAGKTEDYKGSIFPTLIGCKDDADKQNMHGVYRKCKDSETDTECTYDWQDTPRRNISIDDRRTGNYYGNPVLRTFK